MKVFVVRACAGALSAIVGLCTLAQTASTHLSISSAPGGQVRVSWPNDGSQLGLQSAQSLTPPISWQANPNTPLLLSNLFLVHIAPSGREQYFRLAGAALTTVASTSPLNREQGVSVNRETIFYFSQPLGAGTLITPDQFFARLDQRKILTRIELSSDRRKATLFYLEPIPGSARLTVTFNATGIKDQFAQEVDADGDGQPGGAKIIQFDTYSNTPVPGTAIIGHVYASDRVSDGQGGLTNKPLERVIITVDGAEETLRATTDATGFFSLPCPAGRFFVHIDGRTEVDSNWPNGAYYPVIGKAWEAVAGRTNNLASGTGEIFLPLIPEGTLQPVSPTQDTVIKFAPSVLAAHPDWQDVQITVPANSLFSDNGTRGGRVGIAPVAADRLPEPLPPGLDHLLDITVQTDGPSNFDRPVPACFPNVPDSGGNKFAPGAKAVLMSYSHDSGRWEVIGSMTTSSDGKLVCTDPGVGIRQPGWHGVQPPPFEPLGGGCGGAGGPGPDLGGPTPSSDSGQGLASAHGDSGTPGLVLMDTEPPLEPLCTDPCDPFAHGTHSIDECLDRADKLHNAELDACEADFANCSPCVASAACTACYKRHQRCLRIANKHFNQNNNDCLKARILDCFNTPQTAAVLTALAAHVQLRTPSTPQDVVAASFDQINQLVLAAGPEGVTPQVQAEIENLLATAAAAAGGNLVDFLQSAQKQRESQLLASGYLQTYRGNAPGYPIPYLARVTRPSGIVELRGQTEPYGHYSLFIPRDGHLEDVSFYDPKAQTFGHIHPFLIPELDHKLPSLSLFPLDSDELDSDHDGLPDVVEDVLGTDPNNPDTNGDGIPDGVELANGINPLAGLPPNPGVVASVQTGGVAQDICAVNELAVIADGPAGVAVFDVSTPLNPIRVAEVQTRGAAMAVAASGQFVAAAEGPQGLAVIDISTPANAFLAHEVPIGGPVRAVAAADGLAYAGSAVGLVTVVDMASGFVLDHVRFTAQVHDLGIGGDVLFVALDSELRSYQVGKHLRLLGNTPLASAADPLTGRRRLFVGTSYALVSHASGFETFDVRQPAVLHLIGPSRPIGQSSFKQIVDAGSGLGLAAVGAAPTPTSTHDVYLYDLSDPSDTTKFLTLFKTPGLTYAVTIHNGLALAAAGTAGLQVVSYQSFDSKRQAPQISLQPNFAFPTPTNGFVQSGQAIRLFANASDDVQVRHVEFYVDGTLAATDGNFPFEYRFIAPQLTTSKTSFTLQARALDTGGNATSTAVATINLQPDTTAPRILQTVPPAGTIIGSVTTIGVVFTKPIDPSKLTNNTLQLRSFGPDGLIGTADDVLVLNATLSWQGSVNEAVITSPTELAPGTYAVEVLPPLADLSGNLIPASASGPIFVVAGTDSDHDGLPDAVELKLGLDPHNPDSNGDGVPDGLEDFDKDGLPNAYEVLAGTDPMTPDSYGNGIKDGDEDLDNEGLTSHQEFFFGTHPLLADSDGDGWTDEAEASAGSDPLDPQSRPPLITILARPPIEVLAPALPPLVASGGAVPLGTVLAQPPLQVVAPAAVQPLTGSEQFATTMAQPPLLVIAPAVVRPVTGTEPFATTLAQPPLLVIAPAAMNLSGSNLGTTVGRPPIVVVAPAAPPVTEPGTTLAQPPVTVRFGNPQLLRTAK
jgi:hypothetical protein